MIKIYTDGSYSSSRNQGGWCFLVVEDDKVVYKESKGLKNTTNNRMEMMAAGYALKYIKDNNIQEPVQLYADSMYVIGTMTLNWKMKKNTDLWPLLWDNLTDNVEFVHVKGHSGDKWNTECDKWAVFGSNLLNCETDLI